MSIKNIPSEVLQSPELKSSISESSLSRQERNENSTQLLESLIMGINNLQTPKSVKINDRLKILFPEKKEKITLEDADIVSKLVQYNTGHFYDPSEITSTLKDNHFSPYLTTIENNIVRPTEPLAALLFDAAITSPAIEAFLTSLFTTMGVSFAKGLNIAASGGLSLGFYAAYGHLIKSATTQQLPSNPMEKKKLLDEIKGKVGMAAALASATTVIGGVVMPGLNPQSVIDLHTTDTEITRFVQLQQQSFDSAKVSALNNSTYKNAKATYESTKERLEFEDKEIKRIDDALANGRLETIAGKTVRIKLSPEERKNYESQRQNYLAHAKQGGKYSRLGDQNQQAKDLEKAAPKTMIEAEANLNAITTLRNDKPGKLEIIKGKPKHDAAFKVISAQMGQRPEYLSNLVLGGSGISGEDIHAIAEASLFDMSKDLPTKILTLVSLMLEAWLYLGTTAKLKNQKRNTLMEQDFNFGLKDVVDSAMNSLTQIDPRLPLDINLWTEEHYEIDDQNPGLALQNQFHALLNQHPKYKVLASKFMAQKEISSVGVAADLYKDSYFGNGLQKEKDQTVQVAQEKVETAKQKLSLETTKFENLPALNGGSENYLTELQNFIASTKLIETNLTTELEQLLINQKNIKSESTTGAIAGFRKKILKPPFGLGKKPEDIDDDINQPNLDVLGKKLGIGEINLIPQELQDLVNLLETRFAPSIQLIQMTGASDKLAFLVTQKLKESDYSLLKGEKPYNLVLQDVFEDYAHGNSNFNQEAKKIVGKFDELEQKQRGLEARLSPKSPEGLLLISEALAKIRKDIVSYGLTWGHYAEGILYDDCNVFKNVRESINVISINSKNLEAVDLFRLNLTKLELLLPQITVKIKENPELKDYAAVELNGLLLQMTSELESVPGCVVDFDNNPMVDRLRKIEDTYIPVQSPTPPQAIPAVTPPSQSVVNNVIPQNNPSNTQHQSTPKVPESNTKIEAKESAEDKRLLKIVDELIKEINKISNKNWDDSEKIDSLLGYIGKTFKHKIENPNPLQKLRKIKPNQKTNAILEALDKLRTTQEESQITFAELVIKLLPIIHIIDPHIKPKNS